MLSSEPVLRVGICDHYTTLACTLHGTYTTSQGISFSGRVTAVASGNGLRLTSDDGRTFQPGPSITLTGSPGATYTVHDVTIGVNFHWERKEDQTFEGGLSILLRSDGTLVLVNEVPLEAYLRSVISSEMSAESPAALLEAHAITSRSWLVAILEREKQQGPSHSMHGSTSDSEVIRWYTREDHDLYDVCADDHCQRYQGVTKIVTDAAQDAISQTRGVFLVSNDEVCDARFSKSCGGITEEFRAAWEDREVPYLRRVVDGEDPAPSLMSETDAVAWITAHPRAWCNTRDPQLLRQILPSFDQETTDFFRWTVSYTQEQLSGLLQRRSGIDFGDIRALVPLSRGTSGRITRLRIEGTKRTLTVGKELEIRRWLSPSHLYSSAFIVEVQPGVRDLPAGFTLRGAGWGHGVGLCQIGAAVMASRGSTASQIVLHYFPGSTLKRLYA